MVSKADILNCPIATGIQICEYKIGKHLVNMVSFFQPGHGEDNNNFVYVASSGHVLIVTYLTLPSCNNERVILQRTWGLSTRVLTDSNLSMMYRLCT